MDTIRVQVTRGAGRAQPEAGAGMCRAGRWGRRTQPLCLGDYTTVQCATALLYYYATTSMLVLHLP